MFKKMILSLAFIAALLAVPSVVLAQSTCVSVYGGGVVCGAQAPEHKPVSTGIADINPAILGGAFITVSGILLRVSRKIKARSSGAES